MRTSVFIALVHVLFALGAPAFAQDHADIEIELEGGMLVTEPRIGEAEFGEAPNPANVADEPGFEADDGVLMSGDVIGFNAVDFMGSNLWYWDGMGAVNFGASPTTLNVEHPVSGQAVTLDSADSMGAPGFTIGTADGDGGMHQDLEFILANAMPDDGVYLFSMEVTSPSYGTSDPLYMVLASGVDETVHEAAVGWVANIIPEPSALVHVLCVLLFVGGLRQSGRRS